MFMSQENKFTSREIDPEPENVFETSDFYLACYLRCDGFKLIGIQKEGKRAVFRFANRADCEAVVLTFFNNEGTVQPLSFSTAIKNLKALIHNL